MDFENKKINLIIKILIAIGVISLLSITAYYIYTNNKDNGEENKNEETNNKNDNETIETKNIAYNLKNYSCTETEEYFCTKKLEEINLELKQKLDTKDADKTNLCVVTYEIYIENNLIDTYTNKYSCYIENKIYDNAIKETELLDILKTRNFYIYTLKNNHLGIYYGDYLENSLKEKSSWVDLFNIYDETNNLTSQIGHNLTAFYTESNTDNIMNYTVKENEITYYSYPSTKTSEENKYYVDKIKLTFDKNVQNGIFLEVLDTRQVELIGQK